MQQGHSIWIDTPLSTHGDSVSFEIGEVATAPTAVTLATTRLKAPIDEALLTQDDEKHEAAASVNVVPVSSMLAHVRAGHLCGRKLDQLIEYQAVDGLVVTKKHAAHTRS